MSTRETAQIIFDCLTDEQLETLLAEAEESIRNGKYYTEDEMDIWYKENFGI